MYDRVKRNFIRESLDDAKITTYFDLMQVLWNGDLTEKFKPMKGIRKGCPLSLYPFVLCMKRLGHSIQQEFGLNTVNNDWSTFSHLFFADDLVLLWGLSWTSVKGILKHHVNSIKTKNFFLANTKAYMTEAIGMPLRFQKVEDLRIYPGMPLFNHRVTTNTFIFIYMYIIYLLRY